MQYVVTFYSHFGAVSFAQSLKGRGCDCVLRPVPRKLSSSCGSCAFVTTEIDITDFADDSVDGIYSVRGDDYIQLWNRED